MSTHIEGTGRGVSLLYVGYSQAAGIVGGLGLVTFLSNFIPIEWHGLVGEGSTAIAHALRPIVRTAISSTVIPLIEYFWHRRVIEPLVVVDYLCAGITLVPAILGVGLRADGLALLRPDKFLVEIWNAASAIITWPFDFILHFLAAFGDFEQQEGTAGDRWAIGLSLSPFLYLVIFGALNHTTAA